ncbi:probable ATP-dependent DNA helicase HFM1 isoform X1 [Leucoraja erinacea]|uniref:probable ATP-dependent DNA helicase HFM1 isoform X1 n=1 Tax=Leucoraja erinaceus TaxID=7782 RepID=UPI002454BB97|nr:probable ATP-dependent DNA helicase HFM1 isoform X1 [Leucoraja erinacea]
MLEFEEDCLLPLDSLFFEKPSPRNKKLVYKETSSWQISPPPPISELPAAQELQEELERLRSSGIKHSKKFVPPIKKKTENDSQSQPVFDSQYMHTPIKRKTFEIGLNNSLKDQSQFRFRSDNSIPSTVLLNDNSKGHSRHQNEETFDHLNCLSTSHHNPEKKDESDNSLFRKRLFKMPSPNNAANNPTIGNCPAFLEKSLLRDERHELGTFTENHNEFDITDYIRPIQQNATQYVLKAHVPPMMPLSFNVKDAHGRSSGTLRAVTEIPVQFRSIFKEFPYFNYIQSKVLDDLLYSEKNFVICSPTGSGKTVIFELAIVRILMEVTKPWSNIKIVYMAPIKALCNQRYEDWKEKFGPIGLMCKELTGDTEMDDYFEIQDAHIIITTPEKWDTMTRKWRDNSLVQLVRLFLIDEAHVVKDESRGATLEVVVSRMKTVQLAVLRSSNQPADKALRFVAVSATIPNVEDIAEWLSDGKGPGISMKIDESHRPVKLRKVVLGFPCSNTQSEFKFDLCLNYRTASVIQTYSEQKPTLVFCATRKGVQQSASILAKDAKFIMTMEHKQRLQKYTNSIKDAKLRDLLTYGVGYHHAGMDLSDRKATEAAFTAGDLPVLFTTSTLAMGVNLPAHLVVIKSTMHYAGGMFQEYCETDILQMMGRAGRPQFDTTATVVIMTRNQTKDKYTQMLNGAYTIESSLHKHLVEHLNAEIILNTITDVNVALEWIRSTFLYIRALKNPNHYGFAAGLDKSGIEAKLQELCLKNLQALASIGLLRMDEEINFKPTETGKLMARYSIAFETMKLFFLVNGNENLTELVTIISRCKEFADIQLRVNEKKILNTLNKDKNRVTIRFPIEGKIKTNEMKVYCLIQAQLGCIPIQEFALTQDMAKIFKCGVRVTKCLSELLMQQDKKNFSTLLNSLILAKCFRAKLWENSSYISRQLEKIGPTLSCAMVNAGLSTFQKIEDTNSRELELIVNRHPPFGNQIKESITHLPKYELSVEQLAKYHAGVAEIIVTITLTNYEQLLKKRTASDNHHTSLIIGDADNQVIYKQKITDSALLKTGSWSKKIEVKRPLKGEELSVNLISSDYVGLDIQQKYTVFYSGPKRFGTHIINGKSDVQNTPLTKRNSTENSLTSSSLGTIKGCTKESNNTGPPRRLCNHYCKNKDKCGHECCKFGVPVVQSSITPQTTTKLSSYLSDLKNRSDTSSAPSVKRLKVEMQNDLGSVNLQQFAYLPKPPLTTLPRYYETKPAPTAQEHNWDQLDICISNCQQQHTDDDEGKYSLTSSKPSSAAILPQQNMLRAFNCDSTDANESGYWSAEGINVTFDLGDDLWGDFDDEKLVQASNVVISEKTNINYQKDSPFSMYQKISEYNQQNTMPERPFKKFQYQTISSKGNWHGNLPTMEQPYSLPVNSTVHGTSKILGTIHHTTQGAKEELSSAPFDVDALKYPKGRGPSGCYQQLATPTARDPRYSSEEEYDTLVSIFDGIF